MRAFLHVGKTATRLVFQINQAFARKLKKPSGQFFIRGIRVLSSGCGWYNLSSDSRAEVERAFLYIKGRLKNFLTPRRPIEEKSPDLFAFEQGLFNPKLLHTKRPLIVKYQVSDGKKVATIIDRTRQASLGLREYMVRRIEELSNKVSLENKVEALKLKFSR